MHSYGLIDARVVVDKRGQEVNLVKLRNPWGSFEWQGDWGDKSRCWTPKLKEELQVVDADDGTFWMAFEDFKQYFTRFQLCKYRDGYEYSSFKLNPKKKYHLVSFEAFTGGLHTFSVS